MWDMRYWLRNHPNLNPVHGGRVFFRLPDNPQTPCLRLYRSGGAVQVNSEAPMQDVRISIEIWGSQWKEYATLDNLRALLEDACWGVEPGAIANPTGNTVIHNLNFTTAFDSPDADTGWPRIVCDVVATVTASTPTVV